MAKRVKFGGQKAKPRRDPTDFPFGANRKPRRKGGGGKGGGS